MKTRFAFGFSALLVCTYLSNVGSAADKPSAAPRPLTRSDIEDVVSRHLKANALYMPGDLIAQSDVEPIFNELIERGYRSPLVEGLYDSFLPDRDQFVKTMRTPEGRMFMRSVAKLPEAYDRLERLSWSVTGRKLLAEMVAAKEDGKKAFEHILSEEGGKLVEKLLAGDPRGLNFKLPTGKVHTANELIDYLCEIYVAGDVSQDRR